MEPSFYILSLQIAITAYIYSDVLTEGGMILNWLYIKLDALLPEMLFKPIIGCYKCVSGQMALWCFLVLNFNQYTSGIGLVFLIANHIFFITLTILLSCLTQRIHRL